MDITEAVGLEDSVLVDDIESLLAEAAAPTPAEPLDENERSTVYTAAGSGGGVVSQTMRERYGDEPLETDCANGCAHDHARLLFVHPQLDEWFCFDCHRKVRVWSL
jgi:hypothetical protein